jgi:hypothetical protein
MVCSSTAVTGMRMLCWSMMRTLHRPRLQNEVAMLNSMVASVSSEAFHHGRTLHTALP